jgi:hypothetical protein
MYSLLLPHVYRRAVASLRNKVIFSKKSIFWHFSVFFSSGRAFEGQSEGMRAAGGVKTGAMKRAATPEDMSYSKEKPPSEARSTFGHFCIFLCKMAIFDPLGGPMTMLLLRE